MKSIEAMYDLDVSELEEVLSEGYVTGLNAVRELGMAIEEGDPQTIADVWLYKVKPYVQEALASISKLEGKQ